MQTPWFPTFQQVSLIVGATAGIILGLGIIWTKAIQPARQRVKAARAVVKRKQDLIDAVTKAFAPNGKTITEALHELSDMTKAAMMVAETAQAVGQSAVAAIQEQRELFIELNDYTHERSHEFAEVLTKLLLQSSLTTSALLRMEQGDYQVAKELLAAQAKVEEVAGDLAAAHERADAITHDTPGAAADAASKSPQATEPEGGAL